MDYQTFTETKPALSSKTIIGILVAIIGMVASRYGVDIAPDDQKALVDILGQVVAAGGALWGIYGRVKAKAQIRTSPEDKPRALVIGAAVLAVALSVGACAYSPSGGLQADPVAIAKVESAKAYLDASQATLRATYEQVRPLITDQNTAKTIDQALAAMDQGILAYKAAAAAASTMANQNASMESKWVAAGEAIGKVVVTVAPYAIRAINGQPVLGN